MFVTGHTGFKGSWLLHWLRELECSVSGYSLAPTTEPSLFELTNARELVTSHHLADIRDATRLTAALQDAGPEIVLHLAAQPVVRRSYDEPALTWETNVQGTVNLLEAVRATPSVKAAVIVTTDKVYENVSSPRGYRETDPLGGHDPYSASKAAAELVVQSYQRSFFGGSGAQLASARGGNVIGGGDWTEHRILPDAARSVARGEALVVRNPGSTRPWQHVLDCLSGYLVLAGALLDGKAVASAFNFGPAAEDSVSVAALLERLQASWPALKWQATPDADAPHEAAVLTLDSSKAKAELGWSPHWPLGKAIEATGTWYSHVANDPSSARAITLHQLREYLG